MKYKILHECTHACVCTGVHVCAQGGGVCVSFIVSVMRADIPILS